MPNSVELCIYDKLPDSTHSSVSCIKYKYRCLLNPQTNMI